MRALLYSRQSVSDSDDTLSLASQSATLHRWAAEQGWHIVGEVRDADQRGWNDERPGLIETIERAQRREYELLVVWKIDRLARSLRILENTLHRLDPYGVQLRSLTEPWANQPLLRQIIAAVAEQQTRDIAANMQRTFAERTRRGLPHGRAPYGYRRDEAGKLSPCADQAPVAADLFARFVAGAGTSELAAWLTERGVPTHGGRRTWAATTVRTLLLNPAYTGAVVVGGVRVEDAHPPLIDPVTWQRAQDRLADYVWTRRKQGGSWLEGHIEHACGARMHYVTRPTRESTNPAFVCLMSMRHGCPVRPGRCAVAHAEDAAWSLLTRALSDIQPPARVLRQLQREEAKLAPRIRTERHHQLDRQQALIEERERVERWYLQGVRDGAWCAAQDKRIAAELAGVTARLAALPAPVPVDVVMDRHAALGEIAGSLDLIPPADRGMILAALGVVVVQPGTSRRPPVTIRFRAELVPFIRPELVAPLVGGN